MRSLLTILFLSCGIIIAPSTVSAGGSNQISVKYGAQTYASRCALCHGKEGYGDGAMPISLKKYPHTNLYENKHGADDLSLHRSIIYGGSLESMNSEMPPWGDELTYVQIESLVLFMRKILDSPEEVKQLIADTPKEEASANIGRQLYQNYCALCHGKEGKGDGKMAKIIKDPPPFNLTQSTVPDEYLKMIIKQGGEKLGRSPRMPPWEGQFSDNEIGSIIKYINTIRPVPETAD